MVVEGINAIPATIQLAMKYKISMPITESVDEVINHGKKPKEMVASLMNRERRSEIGLK